MEKLKVNFEVKEKSIQEFFENFVVSEGVNSNGLGPKEINPYNLLGKDIHVKKIVEHMLPKTGIVFTLSDKSRGTGDILINTYTYEIEPYDSLSIKLVLVDFTITNKVNDTKG